MNLALIGPSGAGKGTHAAALCACFRLRHVATGDLFREHLESGSELGRLARSYLDRGDLVPDEVVDAMIEAWCEQHPAAQGILFDGFPRTTCQARFLDALLQRHQLPFDAVIYLRVPDAEIGRRLAGRLLCRRCHAPWQSTLHPPKLAGVCDLCHGELRARPDDTPALVANRLRGFHRTTGPLLEYYADTGRLAIVSGEGTLAEVGARLAEFVAALEQGRAAFATRAQAAPIIATELSPPNPEPDPARLDLVLLGGPGSGKGTQAERLCAELQLPHVATGDLFRANLRDHTELGRLARTYMDRGELVPDDITDAMVEDRLAQPDTGHGVVLDGFPRNLTQATALREIAFRLSRPDPVVLYIRVPDEALLRRLSGRLVCRQCQTPYHLRFQPPRQAGVCDACHGELYQRDDDHPGTVRARLLTFHSQTEPLIAYYRRFGRLHEIDGEGSPADITARCLAALPAGVPAGLQPHA